MRAPRSSTASSLPAEVEWQALSPASREILGIVGLRLAAGWTPTEIAAELEQTRPRLRHQPTPRHFTSNWISLRVGELREEIRAQDAS